MDGVINVYKEKGITSFDVVRKMKKLAATGKVGHTGTLDPLAEGVLPICIGKGTKLVDYIMGDYKIYKAEMKLGVKTDTLDVEGKILVEREVDVKEHQIRTVIEGYIGEVSQIPPMYSALKVDGKRLYDLARAGIEVERKSRNITIYSIEINEIHLPLVTFTVKCSKGTYIRTLIDDIGEDLGCGAMMTALERTAPGDGFRKDNSYRLEQLEDGLLDKVISIEEALASYEKVVFQEEGRKLLLNGVRVGNPKLIRNIEMDKLYRTYIGDEFIGLGRRNEDGFKMEKLF